MTELNSAGSQLVLSAFLGGLADEDDGGDFGAIAVTTWRQYLRNGKYRLYAFPDSVALQGATGVRTDAFVVNYSQPASSQSKPPRRPWWPPEPLAFTAHVDGLLNGYARR